MSNVYWTRIYHSQSRWKNLRSNDLAFNRFESPYYDVEVRPLLWHRVPALLHDDDQLLRTFLRDARHVWPCTLVQNSCHYFMRSQTFERWFSANDLPQDYSIRVDVCLVSVRRLTLQYFWRHPVESACTACHVLLAAAIEYVHRVKLRSGQAEIGDFDLHMIRIRLHLLCQE